MTLLRYPIYWLLMRRSGLTPYPLNLYRDLSALVDDYLCWAKRYPHNEGHYIHLAQRTEAHLWEGL